MVFTCENHQNYVKKIQENLNKKDKVLEDILNSWEQDFCFAGTKFQGAETPNWKWDT